MKHFFKYTLATLLGLFLFSILSFLFCLLLISGLSASSVPSAPEAHSVYCLDLDGTVVERTVSDDFAAALQGLVGQDVGTEYGLNDLLYNIQVAKEDPAIEGIYLRGGSLSIGPASAQVLRRALLDFRESGKFIVAYADDYTQTSYYIASVADHLYVNPSGSIAWHGQAVNIEFFPRLLQKLGVEMQVVKVGTFKSAVEPYILTGMSDANRLQYDILVHDLWQEKLQAVSASRGISVDSLNLLADRFMTFAPQSDYVTTRLVDSLLYVQDVDSILTSLTGTDEYTLLTDARITPSSTPKYQKDKVAVIYAEGDITDHSGNGIVGDELVETIEEVASRSNVKAVVLRVNSGGGSAYASEQIHHALTLLRSEKPLVVSMGDYAASGGYYISCPANYIFAEPTTLTGSIGIFGMIPNLSRTFDMLGIDFDGVSTNAHSSLESNIVYKGMNPEERALLQAEINRGYDLFTRRCAEGRGISQDSIKAIGEGRVWSGTRALQIGLVDELGGLDDAIRMAASLAELADGTYAVVDYPELEDSLTRLLNTLSTSAHLLLPSYRAERLLEQRLGRDAYRHFRYFEQLSQESRLQARLPYLLQIP